MTAFFADKEFMTELWKFSDEPLQIVKLVALFVLAYRPEEADKEKPVGSWSNRFSFKCSGCIWRLCVVIAKHVRVPKNI